MTVWHTVVQRWPGSARGHYNYGIELVAAGRRAEGIEEYRRALPGSADAHYALGFELQADGRYDEALDEYRAFIARKPLDITVPRAYHQIGRTLLQQGRHADALAAFDESLARNPREQGSLGGRADALVALERLPEAVTAYQRYLRAFPNSPDAMMNLGLTLVKLDRDAEARDLFAAVVQLNCRTTSRRTSTWPTRSPTPAVTATRSGRSAALRSSRRILPHAPRSRLR